MLLCCTVVSAIFGLWAPAAAKPQRILTQEDAEGILELLTDVKRQLKDETELNASCFWAGGCYRYIDALQLSKVLENQGTFTSKGQMCGTKEERLMGGLSLIQDLVRNVTSKMSVRQRSFTDKICGDFPEAVMVALKKGELAATKRLILEMLANWRHPVATPDIVSFMENTAKIIGQHKVHVEDFGVSGDNIIESLLFGVLAQNEFASNENYQLLQLVSSLENTKPLNNNLFMLMKNDSYPKDVIQVRNILVKAVESGVVEGQPSRGCSPPDKLLSLLTTLTAQPNSNKYSAYAHVLFPFFRLQYLATMGYKFVPKSLADIAFLLNSFLTVRSPILLNEIYMEFTKMPWQSYLKDMSYSEYSNPRIMFQDMIRSILNHPESLKVCNTLIFHYFLNADAETCPDWLKITFPDSSALQPIEVRPPPMQKPPLPNKFSLCKGKEIRMIDPECLVEIIASTTHAQFIMDILRYNPAQASKYPYNTRQAAFQAILDDLKNNKYNNEIDDFVISQAIYRIPLNEKKTWPLEFIDMCPSEIEEIHSREEEVPARPFVNTTENPREDWSTQFKTGDLAIDAEEENAPTTEEISIIHDNQEDDDILCEKDEITTEPSCPSISIINQQSLIDIMLDRQEVIERIIFMVPVIYENYKDLSTQENVLKTVVLDRLDVLNDSALNYAIPQVLNKLSVSPEGSAPPMIEAVCENQLMYNLPYSPPFEETEVQTQPDDFPCTNVKTINPYSLIELLTEVNHIKLIQHLILSSPITASNYSNLVTRGDVLRAVLKDRSEAIENEDVEFAVSKIPLNVKSDDPLEYVEECLTEDTNSKAPESNISPHDVFNGKIVGLGEKPIPCENDTSTTPVPLIDSEDTSESTESTEYQTESINEDPATFSPPEEDCIEDESSSIGSAMSEYRKDSEERELQPFGDHLLSSILDIVKLNPTKKRCKAKPTKEIKCPAEEIPTTVVKIDSLWDALTTEAPRAPYIRNKVRSFVVPIEKNNEYTKAEVLQDILLNVRQDVRDPRVLQNVDQLIKCLSFEGPGVKPPDTNIICLPISALNEPVAEKIPPPNCTDSEVLISVIQTESLYVALEHTAPRTPYIRNKINNYLIPVDSAKKYTKGEVLRDILLNLKEDVKDQRVAHNIDILLGYIRNDGPALEQPDVVEVCLFEDILVEATAPQTTITMPMVDISKQEPLSEIIRPELVAQSDSEVQLSEDTDCSGEPSTTAPHDEPFSSQSQTYEGLATLEESTMKTTEEAKTTTSESTFGDNMNENKPELPRNLLASPQVDTTTGEFISEPIQVEPWITECPCPNGKTMIKTISNQSIVSLLPLTHNHLMGDISKVVMPVTKYTNQSRIEILKVVLNEIAAKPNDIQEILQRLPNQGKEDPEINTLCVLTEFAKLHIEDVVECSKNHMVQNEESKLKPVANECPCSVNQSLIKVIDNEDIISLLSSTDHHLGQKIQRLKINVGKYGQMNRKQILQSVLMEIIRESDEIEKVMLRSKNAGSDLPNIKTLCVPNEYAKLYTSDIVGCKIRSNHKNHEKTCRHPIDILEPESLIRTIDSDVVPKAIQIVDIIMSSSLAKFQYKHLQTRAEVMKEILTKMREIALEKLYTLENEENNSERVKQMIGEIDILYSNIVEEGEGSLPPLVIKTCVEREVYCDNGVHCPSAPEPEEHQGLKDALRLASSNVERPTVGKRKIKKTKIVYNTKETINVNIQAAKPNIASKGPEEILKISEFFREKQMHPESEIAQEIDKAVNLTDKILNQ